MCVLHRCSKEAGTFRSFVSPYFQLATGPIYGDILEYNIQKYFPSNMLQVFLCIDILKEFVKSQVYRTVHHLDSWIKIDQLDVTRLIVSVFTAQHVSNISTSIFRSLRLTVDLFHVLYFSGSMCFGVTVWFGWGGVVSLCRLKWQFNK